MTTQQLPHAVQCGKCNQVYEAQSENPFVFMEEARQLGWVIPLATENKPINCPKCAGKT